MAEYVVVGEPPPEGWVTPPDWELVAMWVIEVPWLPAFIERLRNEGRLK